MNSSTAKAVWNNKRFIFDSRATLSLLGKICPVEVNLRTAELNGYAASEGVIFIRIVDAVDCDAGTFEQTARLLRPADGHCGINRAVIKLDWSGDVIIVKRGGNTLQSDTPAGAQANSMK